MKLGSLINLAGLWKRPKPVVGATPADVVHAENAELTRRLFQLRA